MGKRQGFRTTSAHEDKAVSMEIDRLAAVRDRRTRFIAGRWYDLEFGRNQLVDFQLFVGDKKFPRTKTMTIVERKAENNRFEDKFYKSINDDGETGRRLWSWKFVDFKKFRDERSEYIQYRTAGGESWWPEQNEEQK